MRGEKNMKKKVLCVLLLLAMLCSLWLLPASAEAVSKWVVGGWLRLRSQPSYSATIITTYPTGTEVTILGSSGGWSRVLTPDYRYGYMDERYLTSKHVQPDPPPPYKRVWTEVNRYATVISANGRGVRLRRAPVVSSSNVLGLYPVGRSVREYRYSNDGWSYIRIDSRYGYMMSQFLTTYAPVPPKPDPKPQPEPQPENVFTVAVTPSKPDVGDTIKITPKPSTAQFNAIWTNDENKLLAVAPEYTVKETDKGYKVSVQIYGLGAYSTVKIDGISFQIPGTKAIAPKTLVSPTKLETPAESTDGVVTPQWVEDNSEPLTLESAPGGEATLKKVTTLAAPAAPESGSSSGGDAPAPSDGAGDTVTTSTGGSSTGNTTETSTGGSSTGDTTITPTGGSSTGDTTKTSTGGSSTGDTTSTSTGGSSTSDTTNTPTGGSSTSDTTNTPTGGSSTGETIITPTGGSSTGTDGEVQSSWVDNNKELTSEELYETDGAGGNE